MLRFTAILNTALLLTAVAAPAVQARAVSAETPTLFAATPLDDRSLSSIHGSGLTRRGYVATLAREHFDGFSEQVAQIVPVTFDNWFSDEGTRLIDANLAR